MPSNSTFIYGLFEYDDPQARRFPRLFRKRHGEEDWQLMGDERTYTENQLASEFNLRLRGKIDASELFAYVRRRLVVSGQCVWNPQWGDDGKGGVE